MKTMIIDPGNSVELILHVDSLSEKSDVRRALIYDVEGDSYILSQTLPPVRPSDIGKSASVTRLVQKGDRPARWGFSGTLIDIVRNYQLGSSDAVQALYIRKTSPIESRNLRMHYRVRPGTDWSTRIEVDLMPVHLIDISLGGALFSHSSGTKLEPGRRVEVTYRDHDDNRHMIQAKVKRAWSHKETRRTGLEYVAVQFMNLDKELERELGREIMAVQRGAIYKV